MDFSLPISNSTIYGNHIYRVKTIKYKNSLVKPFLNLPILYVIHFSCIYIPYAFYFQNSFVLPAPSWSISVKKTQIRKRDKILLIFLSQLRPIYKYFILSFVLLRHTPSFVFFQHTDVFHCFFSRKYKNPGEDLKLKPCSYIKRLFLTRDGASLALHFNKFFQLTFTRNADTFVLSESKIRLLGMNGGSFSPEIRFWGNDSKLF